MFSSRCARVNPNYFMCCEIKNDVCMTAVKIRQRAIKFFGNRCMEEAQHMQRNGMFSLLRGRAGACVMKPKCRM